MDAQSTELEVTDHVEAWTYKICAADDVGGAVIAITKGQALVQRTTDNGTDLSGWVYPSTKEDPNFVGFAAETLALEGSEVTLAGRRVTVDKHGFMNGIKANGALINGDRLMTSGPSGVVLADAAGHYGTVVKYPGWFHEHHVVTKAEAAAFAFALSLKAAIIIAVWNETQNKHIVMAPLLHVSDALYGHMLADQKTINLVTADIIENDHIEVDYIIDPSYVIGTVEVPAADNAKTQVNLVNRGV